MNVYDWFHCNDKTLREQELVLAALGSHARDKLHRWKYHRMVSFIVLVLLRHQPNRYTRGACNLEPDETGAFLIQELLTTPELLALSVTEWDLRQVVKEGKEYQGGHVVKERFRIVEHPDPLQTRLGVFQGHSERVSEKMQFDKFCEIMTKRRARNG